MEVFSNRTAGQWQKTGATADSGGGDASDPALAEIQRSFSDCFRCNNLIVLAGLGTSLHVNLIDGLVAARMPLVGKRIAPTMSDLWAKVADRAGAEFSRVADLCRYPVEEANIESLLSYCKVAETFVTEAEGRSAIIDFIKLAEGVIRDEIRFLEPDDDVAVHAEFLRRLTRRTSRKSRAKIFTTNYDLCFEHAARQGRYVIVDGFSHTSPQVFDSLYFTYDIVKRAQESDSHDFISNVFLLYKLHGSIDWTLNPKSREIEKDVRTDTPLLIYPRSTKYQLSFEQPYIEMMAALQAALRQPDTGLLVIGFGFNDNHISEPVLSAIRSNLSLKVAICDPFLAPREGDPPFEGNVQRNTYLKQISYLIERGDARLTLINGRFDEVVGIMPDIAAETDLEQHMERIRLLRGSH